MSLFASSEVAYALLAGAVVAALSGCVGLLVILRRLSFAGHAVTDVGMTGGAAAILTGIDPFVGLVAFSIGAATGIALLGEREEERDVSTGLVLAASLGLGALFLHLSARGGNGQSSLLFGSIFELDPHECLTLGAVGLLVLIVLATFVRPLLFATLAPAAARVAGVPVRTLGTAFLVVMAIAVAEAATVVGVLIATALLVGPAASAIRLSRRPLVALVIAAGLGIGEMWLGTILAYESFTWTGRDWPVSFFVAALALVVYVVSARGRES